MHAGCSHVIMHDISRVALRSRDTARAILNSSEHELKIYTDTLRTHLVWLRSSELIIHDSSSSDHGGQRQWRLVS